MIGHMGLFTDNGNVTFPAILSQANNKLHRGMAAANNDSGFWIAHKTSYSDLFVWKCSLKSALGKRLNLPKLASRALSQVQML